MKCNASDVVMVENASWGANAVLRSIVLALNLRRGDKILIMNVAYPMIVNTVNYLAKSMGLEVVTANLTYPVTSQEQVIQLLRTTIDNNPGIRVASLVCPLCVFLVSSFVQFFQQVHIPMPTSSPFRIGLPHTQPWFSLWRTWSH